MISTEGIFFIVAGVNMLVFLLCVTVCKLAELDNERGTSEQTNDKVKESREEEV